MLLLSLAFFTSLIHASPHNIRDNLFMQDLTDNLSPSIDPVTADLFDDGSMASLSDSSGDESAGNIFSSTTDTGSRDVADLWPGLATDGNSQIETSDYSQNGITENEKSKIDNLAALPLESYNPEGDTPIDLGLSSVSIAPCSQAYESSTDKYNPSAIRTADDLDQTPILEADENLFEAPIARRQGLVRGPGLDRDPDEHMETHNAFSIEGIPIKPQSCPSMTKKACCIDESFTLCWFYPRNPQLCRFAKFLFCCGSIRNGGHAIGGPGIDCQAMRWSARNGRMPVEPPNRPNQLEKIFDIFQFPDLSPKAPQTSCPNPSRS